MNPKAKERARALQAQAMRLSDNADLGKVAGLTNESLRLKNAYGVSEMGSLALNARLRRFKGQEGAANIAIAMHQASKQDNATIDESIQAILQNFNSNLSQSIAVSADNIAQGIGSLSSSLQYRISGKNYSTLDAARMANRLDHGFASAANLRSDQDILALQAAKRFNTKNSLGSTLQDARETLEAGFSDNPELHIWIL